MYLRFPHLYSIHRSCPQSSPLSPSHHHYHHLYGKHWLVRCRIMTSPNFLHSSPSVSVRLCLPLPVDSSEFFTCRRSYLVLCPSWLISLSLCFRSVSMVVHMYILSLAHSSPPPPKPSSITLHTFQSTSLKNYRPLLLQSHITRFTNNTHFALTSLNSCPSIHQSKKQSILYLSWL